MPLRQKVLTRLWLVTLAADEIHHGRRDCDAGEPVAVSIQPPPTL
jgi:hypothetical protein